MDLLFRQLNPHACRTCLVGVEGSNGIALIDPVLEHTNDHLELLDCEGLRLTHVIDTHTHADHISGGSALRDHTDCACLMQTKAPAQCVTDRIEDGAMLDLLGIEVRAMHTPGHTKDSMSLIFPDRILTGDVLKANYACARDPGAAWVPVDAPACEVKGILARGVNDLPIDGIAPAEVLRLLGSGDPPVLLDVHEQGELSSELGHIPGIKHIPIMNLAGRLSELEGLRHSYIVVVCRSGSRAHTAAQILIQAGFERVRVLSGGMIAWKAAGLPVSVDYGEVRGN